MEMPKRNPVENPALWKYNVNGKLVDGKNLSVEERFANIDHMWNNLVTSEKFQKALQQLFVSTSVYDNSLKQLPLTNEAKETIRMVISFGCCYHMLRIVEQEYLTDEFERKG